MRKCNTQKPKYDNFYTRIEDIENICNKYKPYLKDKVVYCNCDDYTQSNFVLYLKEHFQELELKQLIATAYKPNKNGIYFEYNDTSTKIQQLISDGNFNSLECTKILKQADLVITNPPFSLFREYIQQLYNHDKKFLVVGNQLAIINKEIFNLYRENKLFIYNGFKGNVGFFYSEYPNTVNKRNIYKEGCIRVSNIVWYTNLPTEPNKYLELTKEYNPEYYLKYDNYNAIEISKTKDIPINYNGVMGVPITFLNKYNPNQFEIVGISASWDKNNLKDNPNTHNPILQGKIKYTRIFIKHKHY